MITDFCDKATEDVYNGVSSKKSLKIPRSIWVVARRKLDMLNSAKDLRDLRVPPNNRLEELKGDLAGLHSIRINNQYRIVFKWLGNVSKVRITDYH